MSDPGTGPEMTVEQVAQRLPCSANTVRKHMGTGALRATKPAGRWLITEADIEEWTAENANPDPCRGRPRLAS
ncbi:MAG TPA: helix-turn-helix domain-containing protein [Pedococcus sp.]|jgi:excisionase family DNA binding protein|nr:helix-turn-helix domain-containing protein [Pedococcus sp.]